MPQSGGTVWTLLRANNAFIHSICNHNTSGLSKSVAAESELFTFFIFLYCPTQKQLSTTGIH